MRQSALLIVIAIVGTLAAIPANAEPAAIPTFSPAAGTYTTLQTVSISDDTPDAQIFYTTDGTIPTTSSTLYTGPVTVSVTTTLRAIAAVTGWSNSTVASAKYTLRATVPTFGLAAGTYTTPQTVSIADDTPGAQIFYTTDGTTPTTGSALYTDPIPISVTTTLRAIAAVSGWSNSAVTSAKYTISLIPATATPAFSPAVGTYTTPQMVSITDATPGARIFYTMNGTSPTTSSTLYTSPITIIHTTTLQAIAVATGYSASTVARATYTIAVPGSNITYRYDRFGRLTGATISTAP